jgi:hypothetical protein
LPAATILPPNPSWCPGPTRKSVIWTCRRGPPARQDRRC